MSVWDVNFPIEGVTYHSREMSALNLKQGAWHDITAGQLLRTTARRIPNSAALVSEGVSLTYAEWDESSERLAAALLALGLRPGDSALFQMGTVVETAIALFGCFKAGIVPVCALPQYREIEIMALGQRSKAKAYFVQADFSSFDLVSFAKGVAQRLPCVKYIIASRQSAEVPGVEDLERLIASQSLAKARLRVNTVTIGPRDVLEFQLSGGTTNVPKIIPRFHGEYLGQARNWANRHEMKPGVVALYALPLIHNAGQVAMMFPSILLDGKLVLMQRMDARIFFESVERERVSHSLSIGPVAVQMLDYSEVGRHDLSSLKCLMSFNRSDLLERHLNVPCTNIFGITEGLLTSAGPSAPEAARFESVGWPVSEMDEVRLVEPGSERNVAEGQIGELCFRGPSVTPGYLDMAEINETTFTSDGFFKTGDLMQARHVGATSCYSFEGRIKDNIDRGGEKFGAEEVESAISSHPAIVDAKVVAMPDRILGEKACAFLVMHRDKEPLSVAQLGNFLLGLGLAKFKLPERIEVMDIFPVTRVGKIDKQALRQLIAEKLVAEQAFVASGQAVGNEPGYKQT
jgi:non-ribosomal peptide synthetase component E (peptide arylation enzyme)